MLRAYSLSDGGVAGSDLDLSAGAMPAGCVWLDLLAPSAEEERVAEQWVGVDLPTQAEMREIEASSRLYEEADATFMTATLVTSADTDSPSTGVVTFVLTPRVLVTVRYGESMAFRTFPQLAARHPNLLADRYVAFAALLDAIVDRLADILEMVQANLDEASGRIFQADTPTRGRDFHALLTQIGKNGDLVSKVRESLLSFQRLDGYARRLDALAKQHAVAKRLKTVGEDIQSLSDHANFLNAKVDFLLNATLGRINIEQNATIKMFSVVAVIFMPPTLIASIYGMNFEHMPELAWVFGYPAALLAMVVAAVLPYLIFKLRGWL